MLTRRLTALAALTLLLPLGLILRFVHLGLPPFVTKYGGSTLWAAAIYVLIVTVLPRLKPTRAALTAFAISVTIELFKLVRTPALDAFRTTLTGKLLIGRHFSLADILAYAVAILCACLIDRHSRKP